MWEGCALRKIFIVLLALGIFCFALGGCHTVSDIPASGTEDTAPAPPTPDSVPEEPEVPPIDLHAVIGKTDHALRTSDPRSGQTILFRAQTNLGNLCADAYRSATGADAAIVCAAEIGAEIDTGEITVGDVFDVFPEECDLITVQATGAEILDCLEIVYRHHPADTPDYAHISGITLVLDENIPTPVQTDEVDRIVGISGPRRVGNVQIGGAALDEAAIYTLTFSPYVSSPLAEAFKDAPTVSGDPVSNRAALSSHISDVLGGVIGAEYSNPFGDHRICTIPLGQAEIPAPSGVLPQVYLTTEETISRREYVTCSITVHDPSGVYSDVYDGESTVKIRGNSTSVGKKAPYNIKFSEKVDLLGLGRGKKWCLLANMYDKTQLRNTLAYSFAQAIGMEYTSKSCLAEVYLNGEYRGMYQICEPVDTGSTKVDIDTENNEYLMELEPYRGYSNPACLITPVFQMILGYNEPEAPTTEQRAWLKDFMTGAENALLSGDYDQVSAYVDVDSFARCYITQELFKNIDYLVSSTRFYIKGGKLYEGPVWDFDLSSGNCSKSYYPEYNNVDTTGLSYEGLQCIGLFNQYLFEYKEFRDLVGELYTEYQPLIVNLYRDNELGQNQIDALVDAHREGIGRNNALWPTKSASSLYEHRPIDGTYDGEIAYLKDWLEKRNAWLWEYYCAGE